MSRPSGSKDIKKRKFRSAKVADKYIGLKNNRWLVLDKIQGEHRSILFKVRCDCGYEGILTYNGVKAIENGHSKSCGCWHKEEMIQRQTKPNNYAAKRKIFNSVRSGALQRGIEFKLTFEEVLDLSVQNCYYCGTSPQMVKKAIGGNFLYNGIDRVDNTKGYIKENLATCCKDCNFNKGDVSKEIIRRAYEFLFK